jgi:hypothetical protein
MMSTILSCEITADKRLSEHPSYEGHIAKQAAVTLGNELMECGALKMEKASKDDFRDTYTISVMVGDPAERDGLMGDLKEARRNGMLDAIAEIEQHVSRLERLGHYGPMQALALRGVADELRRKLGEG